MARPSSFRPEFCEQATKLCRLGATDKDMADFFGVSEQTLNAWKQAQPAFLGALKTGKALADATVADSLYRRATGYSHDAVKIFADAKTGAEHVVPYVERYPPDTTACIFWLKNRRKDLWRDVQDRNVTVDASQAFLKLLERIDGGEFLGNGVAEVEERPAPVRH